MSSPNKQLIVIIGGGPCGLGSAWRIEELIRSGKTDIDWLVIDRAGHAGGLATTITDPQGFLWDMGGHVIFSHYAYFSRLLDYLLPPSEWNEKIREAWVWMRDRFIPYPLQQNLHRLPQQDIIKSIEGLVQNDRLSHTFTKPQNFQQWLIQSFGAGLCEVFMFPYNKKVWAYTPDQMNVEWMGERVATVDTMKVMKNVIIGKDELGWGPNNTFRFPMHGGSGAIWTAVYNALPAHKFLFNKQVTSIDATQHILSFNDHSSPIHYDHLISTMPMDQLCRIVVNTTSIPRSSLLSAASQFKYSSSHILGFGILGQPPSHLATKCWMYFPEDNCPFYRCTVFSNYSPYNVAKPGEQWSLMCEVAESSEKPIDINTIIQITEQGLLNTQLLSPTDTVISRFHTRLEYGYPTPFYGRDQLCNPIHNAFAQHNIYSRGRFGSWKYEVSNQDHSLMLGVECVDHILFGTEEMTFKYPNIVNNNRDNVGRVPVFPPKDIDKKRKTTIAGEQEEEQKEGVE